jgi:4-amino-4-deoxy-L-arabinose transferase-like glycosyltransferase
MGFLSLKAIHLAAVLVLVLLLRLMGVGWGLPLVYHPDEPKFVDLVVAMMQTGDFNPHYFVYPSLFLYLLLPFGLLVFAQGVTKGTFVSLADLVPTQMLNTGTGTTVLPSLYLLGRLEMTLFGLVAIYLIYRLGRELYGWQTGILAALLLTLSPINLITGYWYRPDALIALLVVASIYAAVRIYSSGSWASYIAAGLLAGLAAASQYNGLVVVATLWIGHFLRRGVLADARPWLGTAMAAIGFLIGMPFALLDMPTWLKDLAWQLRHYYVIGHAGADGEGLIGQARWYLGKLLTTMGILPLFALIGVLKDVSQRRWVAIILIAFPAIYLPLIIRPRVHTIMMLTPILPFLALLAARGFATIWRHRPTHGNARWLVTVGLLVTLLAVPWLQTLSTVHMFARPEVRTLAREWIVEHLPIGARIAMESYTPLLPDRFDVVFIADKLADHPPEWYVENQFDLVVASSATYGRYYTNALEYSEDASKYDQLFETFALLVEIQGPFQFMADPNGVIRIYQVPWL